jgi:hypothetical protein
MFSEYFISQVAQKRTFLLAARATDVVVAIRIFLYSPVEWAPPQDFAHRFGPATDRQTLRWNPIPSLFQICFLASHLALVLFGLTEVTLDTSFSLLIESGSDG